MTTIKTPPLTPVVRRADAELLAGCAIDPACFHELFERHVGAVRRYVASRVGTQLADDIAAEVFAAAYRHRERFHGSDAGHATIDGRDAIVIADSEPGMHRFTYVDPDSWLPIRMVERPDGVGKVTIDYRYLDASHRNVLDWTPPAGARQVDTLPAD